MVVGVMVSAPLSNVAVIWTAPGFRRTMDALTVCPATRDTDTGPAETQVGLVLAVTWAQATPKVRAAMLALPEGREPMVRVAEAAPGVMAKSWVFAPQLPPVEVTANSRHRASLGTLIKAMETEAVSSTGELPSGTLASGALAAFPN